MTFLSAIAKGIATIILMVGAIFGHATTTQQPQTLGFGGGISNPSTAGSLGGTVAVANGGTGATNQVTNGVNYFNGSMITSNSDFTFDGVSTLGIGPSALNCNQICIQASSTLSALTIFNPSIPTSNLTMLYTGNVGIGTTTPNSFLTIASTATGTSTSAVEVGDYSNTSKYIGLSVDRAMFGYDSYPTYNGENGAASIWTGSNKGFELVVNSSTNTPGPGGNLAISVDQNANVGIGTSTPGSILSIANSANFSSTATSSFYQDISFPYDFVAGKAQISSGSGANNEVYTISMAGGRGMIGMDSTNGAIALEGGSSKGVEMFANNLSNNFTIGGIPSFFLAAGQPGFGTSGFIGIGTTSPSEAPVTIANATKPQLSLVDTSPTDAQWTLRSIANTLYIATSTFSATSTSAALSLSPNGALTLSGGLPVSNTGDYLCINTSTFAVEMNSTACTISSEKVKNNIVPLSSTDGLAAILKLNPVTFNYDAGFGDVGEQIGLIAEQASSVSLLFASHATEPVKTPNGTINIGDPSGINWNGITTGLVLAVQQQQSEIEQLQQEMNQMKEKESQTKDECIRE